MIYLCVPRFGFRKVGYPERVSTVLDWLTLPEADRPDMITLYFDEPDHAGHQKGPDSVMVRDYLEVLLSFPLVICSNFCVL